MTEHPESAVIADIDALIDAQLAAGPHDDYEMDYYPRCECGREWHGLPLGRCPGSPESNTVEVVSPEVPWGFISDDGNPVHIGNHIQTVRLSRGVDEARRGYTITVDEARQLIPGFRDDYSQRHILGVDQVYTLADVEAMRSQHARVRFWQDCNGHRWLLEGVPEVQRCEVGLHPMVRLHARLHDVMQAFQALGVAFEQATAPLTEMIEDLITMEVETPGGFEPLGYIHPENFEFVEDRECVREWVPTEMVDATRSQTSLTGRFVQTFAVRHEVTVEFDPMTVGPGMERLIR